MVGFLGVGLIIAAGLVSGQFKQFGAVITNQTITTGNFIATGSSNPVNAIPVDRNQVLLIFGEVIFVIIAVKLAQTSDAANKVLVALFVALWFVWAMYNSQTLSNWVAKVQPKIGG